MNGIWQNRGITPSVALWRSYDVMLGVCGGFGFCDWDEDTSLCYRVVEKFWDNLSVVPFCYIASENHRGNLSDVPASGNVDVDMRLVLENEHS